MTYSSWRSQLKCRQECTKIGGEIFRRCQGSPNLKVRPGKDRTCFAGLTCGTRKTFGLSKQVDGKNPYEVIRGMWEGAYVSHFVRLFWKKFGFPCLSTEELEEALVVEESIVLADVCARLLRYLTGNKEILIANFDSFLRKLLIKEKAQVPRFLDSSATWQDLTPEEKLGTLKWLIDHVHQEKEEDIADFLDENYSPDELVVNLKNKMCVQNVTKFVPSLKEGKNTIIQFEGQSSFRRTDCLSKLFKRGICAGQDAFNNVYWYLDDLRLYRELNAKKANKKEWECVCSTLSDWQSFLKQFRKTTNPQEKDLYAYLNFELFPIIEIELLNRSNEVFKDKEAENIFLIKREREELEDMLEKKSYVECANGSVSAVDVNGTEPSSYEKLNGSAGTLNSATGNGISPEFVVKTDEKPVANMNHCDGHLSIPESISPITSNLNSSTMDIKSSGVSSMCTNNSCGGACAKSCANPQDSCGTACNGNGGCGNGSHCNNTTSSVPPVNRDSTRDVNIQQPLSDNPSDSSSVTSNKENAPPVSTCGSEVPPMSAMSNMVGSTSAPTTTASVQPLPSNMVNKTSFPIESQYMQQQSQIFVFSTALANKAAESYLQGHFTSIIAFHCAQPGTKTFLEKYPLKVQQFNRQNPAAWLNTLAQMKQGGRQIKGAMNQFPGTHTVNNRFSNPSGAPVMSPCTGPCNVHAPGLCANPRGTGPWPNPMGGNIMGPGMHSDMCGPGSSHPWTPQQFGPGMPSNRFQNPMSQGMNARGVNPSTSSMLGCMGPNVGNSSFQGPVQGPAMNPIAANQGPGGPSTLTGVKVPDENLTPQQRQHREEQLAMIRKMQQLLFPEQQQHEQSHGGMMTSQPSMGPVPGSMSSHVSHPRFGPGDMCVHPGMDMCFSPHQMCMGDHEHPHPSSDMFMGPGMMGPGFPQQGFPPVSMAAQLEWQKLQQQFYEERRKKHGCSGVPLSHPPTSTPLQQQQAVQQQQQPPPSIQQQQTLQPSQSQGSQPSTPQQPQTLNSPSPNMGPSPGSRMQGPPPPYHQTTRRPMASPHPSSPNPGSLSLSSPRAVSGLPSPADPSRQFPHPTPPAPRLPHPSPGAVTPAGGNSLHTTPHNSPKPVNSSSGPGSNSSALIRTPTTPSNTASTPSGTPTSSCVNNVLSGSGPNTPAAPCGSNRKQVQPPDSQDTNSVSSAPSSNSDFTSVSCPVSTPNDLQGDILCHGLNTCSQSGQKQENCSGHSAVLGHKEPSLMPVPSPQQIQYLNAFDGQELTIQKQPNTSIRDLDIMSPASMPPSIPMSSGSHSQFQSPECTSFPDTPGSCPSALEGSQDSLSGRYPASAPASMESSNMHRFTVPSPQMPGFESGHRHMMQPNQMPENPIPRFPGAQNLEMPRIPGPVGMTNPAMEDTARFPGQHTPGPTFGTGQPGIMENVPRYPASVSEAMQRFRGPSPQGVNGMEMMHSRFMGSSPHMPGAESMQQPVQFGAMGPEAMPSIPSHSYPSPSQTMVSQSSPCVGANFAVENNMGHSHLQNLQKMTPPFENVGNKMSSEVMSPMGHCAAGAVVNNSGGNMNIPPYGVDNQIASSTQVGSSQRLTHFDPIASMAAMSESANPLVTTVGSAHSHQSLMTSSMNMSHMHTTNNPNGSNQPSVVSFHTNMQSIQGVLQSSSSGTMSNQQNQYNMANHMTHNANCGPQTVNNTYVNATMSIQQLNIQNVTTTAYNSGVQVPSMNMHVPMVNQQGGCQGGGANTVSCSVTTNHPIMHSAVSTKTSVNMGLSGTRQSFTNQSLVSARNPAPVGAAGSPTMMARAPIAAPFNSTNVQVKASAPNTIQYLPARPQNSTPVSNRPPTLEFLQRYAAPLTNLDNKVPTHNLQYFPNSGNSGGPPGGPGILSGQRAVNMMMGPMMRGVSPSVAVSQTGNQMFSGGSGSESPMFGRPPGPSVGPHGAQMVPLNSVGGGQGLPMFPNKQMPLPLTGMTPDATQPLPPSMGQSFNYKQSPFYGPTTADPNYAVQFHNFQQQLYATNTRSQMNAQSNITGQGFFGPK